MTRTRCLAVLAVWTVGCFAPPSETTRNDETLADAATTALANERALSTEAETNERTETPGRVVTPPPVEGTLDDPQGGTTLTATAHVRERVTVPGEPPRRLARDGRPRLELVPLGHEFFVRVVNDRSRTTWVILHPRKAGNVSRDFIDLVGVDADRKEWPAVPSSDDCSGGSSVLRIPPGTTLGLGRARAYQAHAADHESWLRVVYEGDVMVQIPGERAAVHVRWSGSTPAELSTDQVVRSLQARYPEAADLRPEDIFVLGEDDVSNTVEIVAEPEAGVVHPSEPTAERLPMPEELRETARELGLE